MFRRIEESRISGGGGGGGGGCKSFTSSPFCHSSYHTPPLTYLLLLHQCQASRNRGRIGGVTVGEIKVFKFYLLVLLS